MIISDIFGALEALANLIGLPFFAVLMGFMLLSIELFVLTVFMLFAVWRIRKEMINMNRKIDLMVQPSAKGAEIEYEKGLETASGKDLRKETEKQPDNEIKKKKYRYKWK